VHKIKIIKEIRFYKTLFFIVNIIQYHQFNASNFSAISKMNECGEVALSRELL